MQIIANPTAMKIAAPMRSACFKFTMNSRSPPHAEALIVSRCGSMRREGTVRSETSEFSHETR